MQGADTYSKNWLFLSDTLYTTRWEQVLALDVEMIELLTWNVSILHHLKGRVQLCLRDTFSPSLSPSPTLRTSVRSPADHV